MNSIDPSLGYSSNHDVLQALASGGNTISPEAQAVRIAAAAILDSIERSVALFGKKAAALSNLAALAAECSQPGWDGQDSAAIDALAVILAARFIRCLRDDVPLPEFAPEPDGSISLDWIASRNHLFCVSLGPSGRLAFAWLNGHDKGHGVTAFDGQSTPDRILEGIKGLL